MKGVILTAGKATRLRPATLAIGKVNLPIYDKPMIFYSVSVMIESGIRDIYIVCNDRDVAIFKELLKDKYDKFGVHINFVVENRTLGSAFALNATKDYCDDDDILLMFGDNIFIDSSLAQNIQNAYKELEGVSVFGLKVSDPERYGVVEKDKNGNILSIEEKPKIAKSNLVIIGLMMLKKGVFDYIDRLSPSARGEYETTDMINLYLSEGKAKVVELPDSCQWFDTGTHDSMLEASEAVRTFQMKNGIIGSIEVALYRRGLISKEDFLDIIKIYTKDYQEKLIKTIEI